MNLHLTKISTFVFLLGSGSVIAGSMGAVTAEPAYNFFIGGTAGIGMFQGQYAAVRPSNGDTHQARIGNNTFLGGGLLGIQTVRANDLYLALVCNALYNSQNAIGRSSTVIVAGTPVANHVATVKNDFQYGGTVRLGKKLGIATPYVIGGVEAGSWEMVLGNNNAVSNRGIAPGSNNGYSKTLVGPQAGIGVSLAVNDNWSAGMEYAHTWFGNVNVTLVDSVTNFSWNHQTKVQQDQVLFSLNYAFNA